MPSLYLSLFITSLKWENVGFLLFMVIAKPKQLSAKRMQSVWCRLIIRRSGCCSSVPATYGVPRRYFAASIIISAVVRPCGSPTAARIFSNISSSILSFFTFPDAFKSTICCSVWNLFAPPLLRVLPFCNLLSTCAKSVDPAVITSAAAIINVINLFIMFPVLCSKDII